jgi:hypothetical protein
MAKEPQDGFSSNDRITGRQEMRPSYPRTHIAAALVGLLAISASHGALARQTASANQPGWIFSVAPYLWLPTVNMTLDYNLPPQLGGKAPTDVSAGPGDYLPGLHFAAPVAAEARYDRFSIVTDILYMSLGTTASHIKELDFFGLPSTPISRSLQTGISSNVQTTIWTLAGGYTLARGGWGNVDVIGGLRLLNVSATTNYSLALSIVGPRGNGATFGGVGSLSGSQGIWNGIAGVRGRIQLGDTGLFIPYYFDVGSGGSQLTWQAVGGLGYQTGSVGISATYRYLSFQQGGSAVVHHLGLGGPMIAMNIDF